MKTVSLHQTLRRIPMSAELKTKIKENIMDEDKTFKQINVKPEVKRQINVIAAAEGRDAYAVISDMVELYKAVTLRAAGKTEGKVNKPVTIAEFVAAIGAKS